jgi:hypothetical protein
MPKKGMIRLIHKSKGSNQDSVKRDRKNSQSSKRRGRFIQGCFVTIILEISLVALTASLAYTRYFPTNYYLALALLRAINCIRILLLIPAMCCMPPKIENLTSPSEEYFILSVSRHFNSSRHASRSKLLYLWMVIGILEYLIIRIPLLLIEPLVIGLKNGSPEQITVGFFVSLAYFLEYNLSYLLVFRYGIQSIKKTKYKLVSIEVN